MKTFLNDCLTMSAVAFIVGMVCTTVMYVADACVDAVYLNTHKVTDTTKD